MTDAEVVEAKAELAPAPAPPLSALSATALREMARVKCKELGLPRFWVASAARVALEAFLTTGNLPTPPAGTTPEEGSDPEAVGALAARVNEMVGARVTEATATMQAALEAGVEAIAKAAKTLPKPLVIKMGDKPPIQMPALAHERLPDVLKCVEAGLPVLLVGPAGSGKTTLASHVALALGRTWTFNSLSAGVSEAAILGRTLPDAHGNWTYRPAPFVNTWRDGGVHLFDELDGADPNMLVSINAALANGMLALPFAPELGVLPRHEATVIIAAANTYGTGASREYVGRNQLDAATLDRFRMSTIEVGYDQRIERACVGQVLDGQDIGQKWLDWCWGVREQVITAKLRRIMSTRSVIGGALLLRGGVPLKTVAARYVQDWTADERQKVSAP